MAALRQWDINQSKASLFDRIQKNDNGLKNGNSNKNEHVSSIKNNLQRIFNARLGECHASYDLGLFDLNNPLANTEEIRNLICSILYYCINNYETRIKDIKFYFQQNNDDFLTNFTLSANLKQQIGFNEKITIDVYLENNRFKVM